MAEQLLDRAQVRARLRAGASRTCGAARAARCPRAGRPRAAAASAAAPSSAASAGRRGALTKSGSPSSSRAVPGRAQRRPHRQLGAQRVLRLLAERDDALAWIPSRGRGRGGTRGRGPRGRGPRPPRRAGPPRRGARRGRARARARSPPPTASSRLSVSASVIARGSDRGTRGDRRPAAGLFSRWPSRQAQRNSERSVERCRAIERFCRPARWREARYERTASGSTRAERVSRRPSPRRTRAPRRRRSGEVGPVRPHRPRRKAPLVGEVEAKPSMARESEITLYSVAATLRESARPRLPLSRPSAAKRTS